MNVGQLLEKKAFDIQSYKPSPIELPSENDAKGLTEYALNNAGSFMGQTPKSLIEAGRGLSKGVSGDTFLNQSPRLFANKHVGDALSGVKAMLGAGPNKEYVNPDFLRHPKGLIPGLQSPTKTWGQKPWLQNILQGLK